MIEENRQHIRYLSKQDIADIHASLAEEVKRDGSEPLPDFRYGRGADIDALVVAPQQRFYDRDAYPALAEKAAIIFYTVNRKHIFPNGNKRMSTLCMLTFLSINGHGFDVPPSELTTTALWLATAEAENFPTVMVELVTWIEAHIIRNID